MESYPVNLLLENRRCLIVGGGAVALRKAARLLEAGARVRVVAPEAVAGLRELANAGRIELVSRRCEAADLEGVFLLFLASDDHLLNRQLLEQAQNRGILCCAVDKNWSAGDFITPASCSGAGLQVAVATGGHSCVRSKSVKNFIAGQLETLGGGVILTTFTVTVEKNPRDELNQELILKAGPLLKLVTGVREFAIFCDGDGLEIVTLLTPDERVKRLLRLILAAAVSTPESGDKVKERCGEKAFTYLLRKTSGLDEALFSVADNPDAGLIGSGLKRLRSILIQSESLPADPIKGWREYLDYCRKF